MSPLDRVIARIKELGLSEHGTCAAAGLNRTILAKAKARARDGGAAELSVAALAALAPLLKTTVAELVGETPVPAEPTGNIRMLALDQLMPSPDNPRRSFGAGEILELAASIENEGLLQNLIVYPVRGIPSEPSDTYSIIAGERRYRALKELAAAGKWGADSPNIPCLVSYGEDDGNRVTALVENLQRVELPPVEEAESFAALRAIDPEAWTTAEIARRIGKTQRYVQQRLAIVEQLAEPAREALRDGKIKIAHARVIAGHDPAEQTHAIERIAAGDARYSDPSRLRVSLKGRAAPKPAEPVAVTDSLFSRMVAVEAQANDDWQKHRDTPQTHDDRAPAPHFDIAESDLPAAEQQVAQEPAPEPRLVNLHEIDIDGLLDLAVSAIGHLGSIETIEGLDAWWLDTENAAMTDSFCKIESVQHEIREWFARYYRRELVRLENKYKPETLATATHAERQDAGETMELPDFLRRKAEAAE